MKKKKGVAVWTSLLFTGLILTIVGLLFSSVREVVSCYTSQKELLDVVPLSFGGFFQPIVYGYQTMMQGFNGTLINFKIAMLIVIVLTLVALIVLLVLSFVKKTYKYILNLVLILVTGVIGLYVVCFVFVPYEIYGGYTIAKQLFTFNGVFINVLSFKINWIASIFAIIFLVGCLLAIIASFGLSTTILRRLTKKEEREEIEEVQEVQQVVAPEAQVKVSEEPVAQEEKKSKKVVLVVKRYDSFKQPEPVIERPTEYPHQQVEVKQLTKEDIRNALKDELDARERENSKNILNIPEEQKNVPQPEIRVSEADVTSPVKEEPLTPTPIIITIPEPVKDVVRKQKKTEEKKPSLTKDEIRDIIREELMKAISSIQEEVKEEVIEEVHEVEVPVEKIVEKIVEVPANTVVEEPKQEVIDETVTVEETPVVEETVVEELKEEPKVEEKVEETPVVEEKVEEATKEPVKIERISFATRVQGADDSLKDSYNHLKSLLLSYGLKSRVSNGGDAFRLHKVNYCKIVVAGNSLKLYLALNPEDYKNSTLPIKDASSKAMYKDIPLVFKVKSGLSLRRAEQLITEMMDKHGLEQVDRLEVKDYVSDLANAEQDGEGDEE